MMVSNFHQGLNSAKMEFDEIGAELDFCIQDEQSMATRYMNMADDQEARLQEELKRAKAMRAKMRNRVKGRS